MIGWSMKPQPQPHRRSERSPNGTLSRDSIHDNIPSMPTDHIVTLLIAERDRLNAAIEVLQGTTAKRRGRPPGPKNVSTINGATALEPARKKRTFSAAQRKQAADRMRKMWAAKKRAARKDAKG
jgi:hypothetical protein